MQTLRLTIKVFKKEWHSTFSEFVGYLGLEYFNTMHIYIKKKKTIFYKTGNLKITWINCELVI